MKSQSGNSIRMTHFQNTKCFAICQMRQKRQGDNLLLVGEKLRQVFQAAVQVGTQLVQHVRADHGPVLVEHFRQRSPVDFSGIRHFLKADPALFPELLVGDLLLELESDHFRRPFKKINKGG